MTRVPDELETVVNHSFSDRALLERAVTHRSVTGERDRHGYQRLEFLGDHVLGAVVAAMVFRQYPHDTEGKLSLRYNRLVCNATLSEIALELGIDRHIVMGGGEARSGMRRNPSILADVLEALIGALYIDGGFATAGAFVRRAWGARLDCGDGLRRDGKTRLQEWAQERGLPLPDYRLLEQTGPSHAPLFTVEMRVEGFGSVRAEGASRRAAEREAAEMFLGERAC